MNEPPGRFRRAGGGVSGGFRRIGGAIRREGAPLLVLAVVALLALAAVVLGVNTKKEREVTGFAEFSVTEDGCAIEQSRSLNVEDCTVLGGGNYSFSFTKSLQNTTPIVSRSVCCPGTATAAVRPGNREVVVYLGRLRRAEVRASLILP
jgi:hypothetical protein